MTIPRTAEGDDGYVVTRGDDGELKRVYSEISEDGKSFSTSRADTYKAVYYAEPVNTEHPAYRFSRNITVREEMKEKAGAKSPATETGGTASKAESVTSSGKASAGDSEKSAESEEEAHMEPEGEDKAWFHTGGETDNPGEKPGQSAHVEPGGEMVIPKKIHVKPERLVCMCINKDEGKYLLRFFPNKDSEDGMAELYLSGETQRYPAPIRNASQIGGSVLVEGNTIKGLTFVKGKDIRLSIDLDYTDYCSLEVELYATSK